MAVFDLKHAILTIQDGDTPANSIQVKLGDGTLTYSEKKNREYFRDRGILSEVRDGPQDPVDVRMDCIWEFIKGDSETTIEDALKKRGGAADWVSSDSDTCAPYAVDLILTYSPVCPTIKGEILTLADFRYEDISHDAKAGTLSVTGKCNVVEADSTRFTRTS